MAGRAVNDMQKQTKLPYLQEDFAACAGRVSFGLRPAFPIRLHPRRHRLPICVVVMCSVIDYQAADQVNLLRLTLRLRIFQLTSCHAPTLSRTGWARGCVNDRKTILHRSLPRLRSTNALNSVLPYISGQDTMQPPDGLQSSKSSAQRMRHSAEQEVALVNLDGDRLQLHFSWKVPQHRKVQILTNCCRQTLLGKRCLHRR